MADDTPNTAPTTAPHHYYSVRMVITDPDGAPAVEVSNQILAEDTAKGMEDTILAVSEAALNAWRATGNAT